MSHNALVSKEKQPADMQCDGLLILTSREDRTPIELFIAGVRGWEVGLRSQFENGTSLSE